MRRVTFVPRNHVGSDQALANIRHCATLGLPTIGHGTPNQETLCIVAGGPSLARYLDDLRSSGGVVVTVNGCHDYLLRNGIKPWACVLADSAEDLGGLIAEPHPDVHYLVASQCHPKTFDRLTGFKVIVWHGAADGADAEAVACRELFPGALGINGGSTAALRCIHLGHVMGFRRFRIYGLDSSFLDDDAYHAYPGALDPSPPATVEVNRDGVTRAFKTNMGLVLQVQNYKDIISEPWAKDCEFAVIGDGLLPYISAEIHSLRTAAAA